MAAHPLTWAYSRKSPPNLASSRRRSPDAGHLSRTSIADYARAKKIVRGLSQGLTEDERHAVADRTVEELKRYGDPWRLNDDEPPWTGPGPPPSSMRGRS